MRYNFLGKTGLKVSALSFGSYLNFGHHVDSSSAKKLMSIAYDSGINLFDTAELYALGKAEQIIGECLKDLKWLRDTYIIGSKVFLGGAAPTQRGLNRKHIIECCNNSLKRLNVNYLDFFLCHRYDSNVPVEEVVFTMNHLIQQGKILYWGTSEWSIYQVMKAHMIAKEYKLIPPMIEQFEYNMFERTKAEKEYVDICKEMGVGVMSTMPLAGGILTGKYNSSIPEDSRFKKLKSPFIQNLISSEVWQEKIEKVKKLQNFAEKIEITLSQLAIGWCLKSSAINTVIIGVSNETQLQENLKSLNNLQKLDPSILEAIDLTLLNKPVIPLGPESFIYEEICLLV